MAPDHEDHRQWLLERKLGRLLEWRVPELVETVGPFQPDAFEKYDRRRQDLVRACQERLDAYSDDEIELLVSATTEASAQFRRDWRDFRKDEVERLRDHPPAWYAGGFGHPDYQADFENWCKMRRFSVVEAMSLSIGIEPGHFQKAGMEAMERSPLLAIEEPLGFLVIRYRQLKRRFDQGNQGWMVRPNDLLVWARQVDFALHPEFEKRLASYHGTGSGTGSEAQDKMPLQVPDAREIDSVSLLLTAVAIDAYGYDPSAKRSPIPNEIVGITALLGLEISSETVRKYLRRGAELLPPDWKAD